MSHIPFHPAPGLGDLLPGCYVVPQNPIQAATRGIEYVPHVGELMPGSFVVPQNPLRNELMGYSSVRPAAPTAEVVAEMVALSGLGRCGCSGGSCEQGFCGCGGGMGQIPGLPAIPPVLLYAAGGLLVLWMFSRPGGKEFRERRSKLRQEYGEKERELKGQYRGYRRAGRATARAGRAALRAATT